MGEKQLLFLYHAESGRRLRIEVPTVFGRSHALHVYTDKPRFSDEDTLRLKKLDWIEIKGDMKVSRTHGVLDPAGPVIRDLNSTNGTYVRGRLVEGNPGREGPPHPLGNGDVVTIGDIHFVVEHDRAADESLDQWLALDRHALLAPDTSTDIAALEVFLRERKRFQATSHATWASVEEGLEALGGTRSKRLGIVVVALAARPDGPFLRMGDRAIDMAAIVSALAALPGTKLLALQADGDPKRCEEIFRDTAYQDMVLVTSTVPTHSGIHEPLIDDMMATPALEYLKRGAAGKQSLAPYHAVLDGLDSLIRPDSNVLDQAWLAGYEGALTVVVGSRLHDEPDEVEVSYQVPGNLDLSSATIGSFRVRHCFDSARDGSSRMPDSSLAPSWREDLRPRRAGFGGPFEGEELLEYLAFFVASAKTGVVAIKSPELTGHIAIERGRVLAVTSSPRLPGAEALAALLALGKGEFELRPELPHGFQRVIDLDLSAAIAAERTRRG